MSSSIWKLVNKYLKSSWITPITSTNGKYRRKNFLLATNCRLGFPLCLFSHLSPRSFWITGKLSIVRAPKNKYLFLLIILSCSHLQNHFRNVRYKELQNLLSSVDTLLSQPLPHHSISLWKKGMT